MKTNALDGMRVIDIAIEPSGSYCARLLADFGADVVKIEDLASHGDPTRHVGIPVPMREDEEGDSARFVYLNQNKRSVALDLGTEEGRELARKIVASADVVVDSGPKGGLAKLGLSFEDVQAANPKTAVVVISPFGLTGPYADRPATHLTLAALGGWLKVHPGDSTRQPIDVGFPLLDCTSAMIGAVTAVAAWRQIRAGGPNRIADVSMQELALRMYLYPTVAAHLGILIPRYRPFPLYVKASNGYAAVNALNATHYRDMCLLMGLDEAAENLSPARSDPEEVKQMQGRMDEWASTMTREEIFELGQAMSIPTAIPYTLLEVTQEPAYHERGFFREIETRVGTFQQPKGPLAAYTREDWKQPPALGENNAEVLHEWLESGEASH